MGRRKTCSYYVDEKSCFSCPYPDCKWNSCEGIPPKTKQEKLEHCEAMLTKYRAARLEAARNSNRPELRRINQRLRYWEKKRLEEYYEPQSTTGEKEAR